MECEVCVLEREVMVGVMAAERILGWPSRFCSHSVSVNPQLKHLTTILMEKNYTECNVFTSTESSGWKTQPPNVYALGIRVYARRFFLRPTWPFIFQKIQPYRTTAAVCFIAI